MDAPAHVIPGGRTIDQLTLEELVADCFVIDVSNDAHESSVVMPDAIEKFEQKHGKITAGSLVVVRTGWSARWNTPQDYHNNHAFPSVDIAAANILLERGIAGLAIDTFSCDTGHAGFPVHRAVLGADKYLVENVAHADKLPPVGGKVLVLPMCIQGA